MRIDQRADPGWCGADYRQPFLRGAKPRLHYEAEIGGWAVPFPTIDPQIVLRSARAIAEYGDDFRYGHYARVRRLPTVIGGVAAVGTVFALAQLPPTRSLLLNVRSPGEGPDEESRARAWFRVVFLARTGGRTVMTEVRGRLRDAAGPEN